MPRLRGIRDLGMPTSETFEHLAAGFDQGWPPPSFAECVARMTVWGTLLLVGAAVQWEHLPSLFVGIVCGQLLHYAWQVRRRNKERLRYVKETVATERLLFPWTVCERHREVYMFKCPKCHPPESER